MFPDEKISFHSFSNTELKNLVQLSKTTYEGREISFEDFLNWEYVRNPEGPALINVADTGSEIVSQYIVLPKVFSIEEKIIKGSLSVNTLTHPGYRNKGLFAKLARQVFERCAEEEIHFTIGFPNPVSHPVIKKQNLFNTIGSVPLLIYPLQPLKTFVKYLSGKRNKTGDEIVLKISQDDLKQFPGIDIFNFNIENVAYNDFIRKFNKLKINVKHRTLEYLKWRFLEIPIRKYYLLKAEAKSELKAILVMRTKYVFGLRCLILVDIISTGEIELHNLYKTAINIARHNNIDLIFSAITSDSPEYNMAKQAGFFSVPGLIMPQPLAFITRKHSGECPDSIDDFKKWFLTFGDFDIF